MRTLTLLAALALTGAAAASAAQPILTPKPGPQPKINGPAVYGVRPGHPFHYRIPCTGERPVRFSAAAWEYAAPGEWNDPDYILIGTVGNAHDINAPPVRTTLTAEE